jgi:hypothetical protein
MHIFIAVTVFALYPIHISGQSVPYHFPYTESIKQQFKKSFHDQCTKYPFVEKYIDLMEHPNGRNFMFVIQEYNLRNGGWGDILAGLITSVELAIRFNRTLVIKSGNNIHQYFRPYHPIDIHATTPQYTWENWLSWSGYQESWVGHDSTEYDLFDCINNTGVKSDHCSMTAGDVSTPTILYRSNRCYLCRYARGGHGYGQQDLRDKVQVKETDNLFEVAGCMMRLALWPTENMWNLVDSYYADATKSFVNLSSPSSASTVRLTRSNLKRKLRIRNDSLVHKPVHPSPHFEISNMIQRLTQFVMPTSSRLLSSTTTSMEKIIAIRGDDPKYAATADNSINNNKIDSSTNDSNSSNSVSKETESSKSNANDGQDKQSKEKSNENGNATGKHRSKSTSTHQTQPFYQLAIHFRCGDSSNIKQGDRSGCVFEKGRPGTAYMQQGNPVLLAQCALVSLHNHTQHLIEEHTRVLPIAKWVELSTAAAQKNQSLPLEELTTEGQFVLVYVTSDSPYSAQQIHETLKYDRAIIAPSGCHAERDSSLQCLELTLSQWFVLSLSSHIAVQVEENNTPNSAYSRYAAVYNLRDRVLLDGKHCDASLSHWQLSHLQQGNWFC